ncbi:MAG: CBS domain-containing protein [Deltaproteobacteria bacterium]|nr:CBS domain-containing protein [Candidatus Anaeroferrophillus wilburensis]MBN2888278.1 CBS domain-containing protein [Deltaproteobacteria bacterium]
MKLANDIMTTPVITVTPETGIKELATLLTSRRISGAPVVDGEGRLLGIVTETDLLFTEKPLHIPTFFTILDSLLYFENPFKMDKEMKKLTASTVADIYTADCLTITAATPVDEIAALMIDEQKNLLPVVDEDRKVVGIISRTNMLSLIG